MPFTVQQQQQQEEQQPRPSRANVLHIIGAEKNHHPSCEIGRDGLSGKETLKCKAKQFSLFSCLVFVF